MCPPLPHGLRAPKESVPRSPLGTVVSTGGATSCCRREIRVLRSRGRGAWRGGYPRPYCARARPTPAIPTASMVYSPTGWPEAAAKPAKRARMLDASDARRKRCPRRRGARGRCRGTPVGMGGATCRRLQSSSVLLANIRVFCSDYLRTTGPECSRSLRTCSHSVRRTRNHRLLLTLSANEVHRRRPASGGREATRQTLRRGSRPPSGTYRRASPSSWRLTRFAPPASCHLPNRTAAARYEICIFFAAS